MKTMIDLAGDSCAGVDMEQNEDSILLLKDEMLAVICDGMGRRSSGKIASTIAIEAFKNYFNSTHQDFNSGQDISISLEKNRIVDAINFANSEIYMAVKKDLKLNGMISTVAAIYLANDYAYLANVGNSRIYKIRDNHILQISEDHSLLNDYLKMNKLTPEEIQKFSKKNVVVRALGMKESVKVDIYFEVPKSGDTYLLCSDGLSDKVSDPEILDIYQSNKDNLQHACKKLIDAALHKDSHDNISVILIRIG